MLDIVSDLGENINWKCYKSGHNDFTIDCDTDDIGTAFDLTPYAFTGRIRKIGFTDDLLTLTEGDGITNGGANGIITIVLTEAKIAANLPGDTYFFELTYLVSGTKKRMIQGILTLSREQNPGSSSTSLKVTVNVNGSEVKAKITVGGGSAGDIPLDTFTTELTFDKDKDLATVLGETRTFTLAASGHKNGKQIIARIDRPIAINFPAAFEAISGSDLVSASSMNIIAFRYFEDYDTTGTGKVLYGLKNQLTAAPFDSDYQAILDRGIALGYALPSVHQRAKQNQLVLDLKAAGIWTLLDIFYVFANNGSQEFATLNWKNPLLYQVSRVDTPVWTTDQGFYGNTTSSYLNTNFTPSSNGVNLTVNNGSFLLHILINSAGNAGAHGARATDGTNSLTLTPRFTDDILYARFNAATAYSVANIIADGTYHSKRTSSTALSIFKNGSSLANGTVTAQGLPAFPVFLEAFNNGGTAAGFSGRGVAMAGMGASLNTLESAFYTAWNTYFTSL